MSCLIRCGDQYVHFDRKSKIKLGPKICAKTFEEQKAKNLIKNPPNNLKKYKFEIEPLFEGKTECEIKQEQILQRAAEHAKKTGCYTELKENLIVEAKPKVRQEEKIENKLIIKEENHNNSIDNWLKKLHRCNGIKEEAQERLDHLKKKLSLIDQAQDVILHIIENDKRPSAFCGWQERMEIAKIRDKRRAVKDEMVVVQMIIDNDTSSKSYDRISSAVSNLRDPKNWENKYSFDMANELLKQFDQM